MADGFQLLLRATLDYLREEKSKNRTSLSLKTSTLETLDRLTHIKKSSPQKANEDSKIQVASIPKEKKVELKPTDEATNQFILNDSPIENRKHAIESLGSEVSQCVKCAHLVSSRTQTVFGVGSINASLMFIGEAPGLDEDKQGEPFVGKAGQLLTKIIQAMGLKRDEVYIANVLKCRPDTPGKTFGNRKPELDEMNRCKPYLFHQINIIRPKVIVALGATALQGLFNKPNESITRARGRWRDLDGIPLMPTYHPSYLLHKESNPSQSMMEKRKVWEDMMLVMEKLDLAVSEKQKRYFTKPAK